MNTSSSAGRVALREAARLEHAIASHKLRRDDDPLAAAARAEIGRIYGATVPEHHNTPTGVSTARFESTGSAVSQSKPSTRESETR